MKKNLVKYVVFILLISILLFSCGSSSSSSKNDKPEENGESSLTGSISGVAVLSTVNKNLLPKYSPHFSPTVLSEATVYVIDYNGNRFGPVTTDSNGNFIVENLPVSITNYIIRIEKDYIVLRHIIDEIIEDETKDIGQVDITTTTLVHLIENRIKNETGQNIILGETGTIPSIVKNEIQNINITQEKNDFKNSILNDSTPSNPIYTTYATIKTVLKNANTNNLSLNNFLPKNDDSKNFKIMQFEKN